VVGPTGGPTVFFDADDDALSLVVVLSPLDNFKASSSGPGSIWDGSQPAWAPGTAGTITSLPPGFEHTFILRAGAATGVTAAIGEWGRTLQAVHRTSRVPDVTLQKIGYETDNCRSPTADCWAEPTGTVPESSDVLVHRSRDPPHPPC
jgi:hypothetical protein